MNQTPGRLLREARLRHRISQEQLASRASTTQSAISRIEADRVSPSIETLRGLLHVLGEDLVLTSLPREWGVDRSQVRERLRLTPEQRLDYGTAFARQVIEMSPNVREEPNAA
jgi:transcriptional regulator with XRE-family HTH domain